MTALLMVKSRNEYFLKFLIIILKAHFLILVWNGETFELKKLITTECGSIEAFQIFPNGNLAFGTNNGTIGIITI